MEEEMEKMGEAETVAEAAKEAVETLKEKSLEELAEENKRLQEENERLKNRSIKERMYDKIKRVGPDDRYLYRVHGACCLWQSW